MSRRNAVCLAVILVTPLAAAAIASAFSVAVGNLFPAMPAAVVAVVVDGVAFQFARVPTRYMWAAEYGVIAYGIGGTFVYTAITVEIVERF